MKSLLRTRQAQALLPNLLGAYLSVALRTTRWTLDGQEYLLPHAHGAPAVVAFWHEFLPMLPILPTLGSRLPGYRPTPVYALASRHRDGRFLGVVLRRFGIGTVLGSSSRGGSTALRHLLTILARGEIIAITPDGPRGPARQAADGVAQLAAVAGVPVIPCAARSTLRLQFNTWDRMQVPLPFGRAVMVIGPAVQVDRDNWQQSVPAITDALNQVTQRADQLCQG